MEPLVVTFFLPFYANTQNSYNARNQIYNVERKPQCDFCKSIGLEVSLEDNIYGVKINEVEQQLKHLSHGEFYLFSALENVHSLTMFNVFKEKQSE